MEGCRFKTGSILQICLLSEGYFRVYDLKQDSYFHNKLRSIWCQAFICLYRVTSFFIALTPFWYCSFLCSSNSIFHAQLCTAQKYVQPLAYLLHNNDAKWHFHLRLYINIYLQTKGSSSSNISRIRFIIPTIWLVFDATTDACL